MPIDPSIALGVRPLQLADPLAQYGQMAQLQNYQTQNQLHQLQMREAEATAQERNALRQLNPSAADYETQLFKVSPQLGIQYRKEQSAAEASRAATAASKVTSAKAKQDMLGQAWRDISGRPSDANITAHLEDILLSPLYDDAEKASIRARGEDLLKLPFAQRQTTLAQIGAKPSDLKPNIVTENLGGTSRTSAIPAFGGPSTVISETRKTPTAGELMVDARARERLAAEQATGVLTPASLDTAAEIYRQTGQMPIGGIGKGVANMRAQIMNRATEMAAGKGVTPADTAANMIVAKQDIGSQTKALKDFSTGIQGRQVNAFNTAIDHLGTMDKLSDALANGDIKAFNSLGNIVARQTGSPAPTNFDAAKQIVTAEVIKAVVASGGGVTERQEAERNFAAANSPQQLKGIINTYKQLLGGQLNSLNLQYENTTGRKDFDKKLTGEAKNVVKELRGSAGGGAAPAGGVDTSNPLLAK